MNQILRKTTTLHSNASIINLSIQRIILIGTKGPIPTLGPEIKSHFVLYQTALHCHETLAVMMQ